MNAAPEKKEIPTPNAPRLPVVEPASDLVSQFVSGQLVTPPPLVHGAIHEGDVGMVAGPSKSRKTWLLLHLAMCVASGQDWWGFQTTKSRVLFLNFEVNRGFFASRISWISNASGLSCEGLDVLNLRGKTCNLATIVPELVNRVRDGGYKLIILDPIYKVAGGLVENANEDAAQLLSHVEEIAEKTGAALLFGHHFAKGNASQKDPIDRASGAGVFARHPDAIITLTPHEEDGAFTCEMILRNCKPVPSFAVGWEAPLIMRRDDLNPDDLRQGGRKQLQPPEAVRQFVTEPMIRADIQRAMAKGLKISVETAKRRVEEALTKGILIRGEGKLLKLSEVVGNGGVTINFNAPPTGKHFDGANPANTARGAGFGSNGSNGSKGILTLLTNDPKGDGSNGSHSFRSDPSDPSVARKVNTPREPPILGQRVLPILTQF